MKSKTECSSGLMAGRLEGASLPDLLWALSTGQRTGVLQVTRYRVSKALYVQEGKIVFASSSDPNDRLGEMLLRKGKVTIDQLERALLQLQTGKRFGTLLVEAGSLTPDELVSAVVAQVRAVVLDVLSWEEGEYRFDDGPLPTNEVITMQRKTSELLLHGIRGIRSFSRVRASVGAGRTVYRLTANGPADAEDLPLREGERQILERLSRSDESIDTLCREVLLSNFEVYQALWAFRILGIVEEREWRSRTADTAFEEGRLEESSFAEVLVRFSRLGQTGVLNVNRRSVERSFHLRDGHCVFATSNYPDDGLIPFLLSRGVISLRDRNEVAKRLLTNKRVGTILHEMGVIDAEDLTEMVQTQLSEIVYDTFRWEDGDYLFVPGALPTVEDITLNRSVESLVSAGLRRVTSWTQVIRGCGGIDHRLALMPDYLECLDAMDGGYEEWQVISALKSPQSSRRVCRMTELGDFRTCQILWTMRLLGAIESRDEEFDLDRLESAPTSVPADPLPDVDATPPLHLQAASHGDVESPQPPIAKPAQPQVAEPSKPQVAKSPQPQVAEPSKPQVAKSPQPQVAEPSKPQVAKSPQPQVAGSAGPTVGASADGVPAAKLTTTEATNEAVRAALSRLPGKTGAAPTATPRASVTAKPRSKAGSNADKIESSVSNSSAEKAPSPQPTEVAEEQPIQAPAVDPLSTWEFPDDIDEVIARFNAMHRAVYRVVRTEIGAGAVNFVRSCCVRASGEKTDPLREVVLASDGSWDAPGLKLVIATFKIEDPWAMYQRILDSEFGQLQPVLGEQRSLRLKREIWEIQRNGVGRSS